MSPLGVIPPKMHAWLIRPERFGKPMEAFQKEVVNIPAIADDEVLVYVMAAGINYNNVWAGLGIPVNVIGARNKAGEPEKFHIGRRQDFSHGKTRKNTESYFFFRDCAPSLK